MSERDSTKNSRRLGKRSEPKALLRFMEELSWLLATYDDLDFRALGNLTDELAFAQKATSNLRTHSAGRPPTIQLLVGVLPSLLTDERLFPTNEDVIEFSAAALAIEIPRWQKKSKFELIGHIVCSTDQANPDRIKRLVEALGDLMDDKGEIRRVLQKQRLSGLSWNEVIQNLLREKK